MLSVDISPEAAKTLANKSLNAITIQRALGWKRKIQEYRDNRWFKTWRRPLTDDAVRAILSVELWGCPDDWYWQQERTAKDVLALAELAPYQGSITMDSDTLRRLSV